MRIIKGPQETIVTCINCKCTYGYIVTDIQTHSYGDTFTSFVNCPICEVRYQVEEWSRKDIKKSTKI